MKTAPFTFSAQDFRHSSDNSIDLTPELGKPATLRLKWKAERDEDQPPPWGNEDGHGAVTKWERRDKRAGEWVLAQDRGAKRFYDAEDAQRVALRDGWGLSTEAKVALTVKLGREPSRREMAAEAVRLDFEHLQNWCEDRWEYLWLQVELVQITRDTDGEEVGQIILGSDSIGGVESCGDYWREQLAEMANRLTAEQDKETAERAYWEARDVETV